ncbi:TetR/AcrR family transcriptional regulator [Schaalia sp. 19OD2882]|uniref:TetR/AcrR family transcriptional regulator n=1 Tax=Schaalia sp. 19OD2882 TaxID=2794089 RepID=UPI001C1E9432|nr:TetR/AcrR family transcriptional regulator [Schaalia sp. 19OD2882]QWW19748.1 TetR/AcrR family transcriptional regulator [Schaalia sp. 19OD2882]
MPKIIGTTLSDHRELTKTRLFDALSELMSQQSFDTITMSQIARRAGVGRTAVYNHFADKEVLLLAFMRQTTSEFATHLRQALADQDDPVAKLRIYLHSHLELTDKFHLASGINLRSQMSATNSEQLHEHADIVGQILRDILEEAMSTQVIPTQDPALLVALIHSTLAGQHLPAERKARAARIATVETFVLRALGVSPDLVPVPAPTDEDDALAPTQPHASGSRSSAFLRCPVRH